MLSPFSLKVKFLRWVKNGINKNVNATVDFKDLSLSLFRHFPKLSVALENVSVAGVNEFAKDTLISAEKIDASVNIMSVIFGSEIKVAGVYLESPPAFMHWSIKTVRLIGIFQNRIHRIPLLLIQVHLHLKCNCRNTLLRMGIYNTRMRAAI
ncbi:MAG: hypothetical protein WDO19_25635 [Bacteroidota bacterium]